MCGQVDNYHRERGEAGIKFYVRYPINQRCISLGKKGKEKKDMTQIGLGRKRLPHPISLPICSDGE